MDSYTKKKVLYKKYVIFATNLKYFFISPVFSLSISEKKMSAYFDLYHKTNNRTKLLLLTWFKFVIFRQFGFLDQFANSITNFRENTLLYTDFNGHIL